MLTNCKNCGATPPQSSSQYSYVCEYCGAKNVDNDYFKVVANTSDIGKSERYARLGLSAFASDEFESAVENFESSILENDGNAEVWIYLALCKSHLLTASNFDRTTKRVDDALRRALELDSTSELVVNGRIAIFETLVRRVATVADYYYETAYKSYVAFGSNKSAASAASPEVEKALDRVAILPKYRVASSSDYVLLLTDSILQCHLYQTKGATSPELESRKSVALGELLALFDENEELIKRNLDARGESVNPVVRLISDARPGRIIVSSVVTKPKGFLRKLFS